MNEQVDGKTARCQLHGLPVYTTDQFCPVCDPGMTQPGYLWGLSRDWRVQRCPHARLEAVYRNERERMEEATQT